MGRKEDLALSGQLANKPKLHLGPSRAHMRLLSIPVGCSIDGAPLSGFFVDGYKDKIKPTRSKEDQLKVKEKKQELRKERVIFG